MVTGCVLFGERMAVDQQQRHLGCIQNSMHCSMQSVEHKFACCRYFGSVLGVFVTREHVRHNKSGIAHRGRTRINHLRELPTKLNHYFAILRKDGKLEGLPPLFLSIGHTSSLFNSAHSNSCWGDYVAGRHASISIRNCHLDALTAFVWLLVNDKRN
jgi:hypothetical protein